MTESHKKWEISEKTSQTTEKSDKSNKLLKQKWETSKEKVTEN